MLRAAFAALLVGLALALALPALRLTGATPRHLIDVYWPALLCAAGLGGLWRGLGPDLYGRWLPLGLLVLGAALLAAHRADVPLGALMLAGLLAWAGLAVAWGGWRRGGPTRR